MTTKISQFWDMSSGGSRKEKWHFIFIEAPQAEAEVIFYNRFGHNPNRVTCTCCGEDYSIYEYDTVEHASAFHRNCRFGSPIDDKFGSQGRYFEKDEPLPEGWKFDGYSSFDHYQTVEQFFNSGEALAIYAKDIKPEERIGEVPEQGYVWRD